MTLLLEEETNVDLDFDYKTLAYEIIEEALDYEEFPYEVEVSLTLTGEDEIKEINNEFRGIDSVTDVLSFPMIEYDFPGNYDIIDEIIDFNTNDKGEIILGDIVLCIPKVVSQAEEFGHSTVREYAFLIAHSMLHLFGYDHMVPEDEAVMINKQKEILQRKKIDR